ncbi:RNA dependent RNA polymerase [Virgibacillus salexigens]|uniref:RDRP core domain-containing protein n=1 Tax=Virgibacillus massiliensis TaxID=1462526 RepID=A0A024QIR6_9BACI|nr:hypothetical protein [Virgibacillus massiliensis]CDQ41851.1 hypothetical protein BN990_04230 [Virgibacillus massiliensis]
MKNQTATVSNQSNQTKGDVIKMENRTMLKENGYLYTVQDILAALSKSEGFKSRDSKNFARVLRAMSEGKALLDILANPSLAGVPNNQVRYFTEFVENNKLAKRVYKPTRKGVLVPIADINLMEMQEDKVYSTIDYSEVNVDSYKEISESFLSETLASTPEMIEFTRNGKLIKQRMMLPMRHVFFVSLGLELPEEEADYDQEDFDNIHLRERVMKDGFYFTDENGEEGHAYFFLRTPSQARVLQAVFIDTAFMSPVQALKLLGHELIAYGSQDNEGNYVVKVDKMITRPGLAGTNTVASKTVDIGNIVEINHKGEQRLVGGVHTLRVVEDRQVEIKTGTYRAWDKEKQCFKEFDANEHPISLTAADGAIFCDEEIYHTLGAEFGQFNDAWQIRITPFVKGLMVFVPNLRAYYDDHIIAFKSAVKGDFANLITANPDFKPQLRIAMFNRNLNQEKTYTDMPYQFVQASSLNTSDLWKVMKPHLEKVGNALHDPSIMKKYVGLDKVIDADLFDQETEHYMIDQSRVSTFTSFLDMFDWTYEDVHMKRYALDVLKEKIADWKTGNVPVEGHYRYLMQDPYAVLEAGTKYTVRNENGDLMITNRGSYHIQPNEAFVPSAHEHKSNVYVAAGRNPMIAKGEWQVVRHRPIDMYNRAYKKGAFRNITLMSVHDMRLFAMGGADVDGDTALTVTDETIVQALKRKETSPVMDISFVEKDGNIEFLGDGVPYSKEMTGVYRMPEHLVDKQNNYKITFTKEQNTDELYEEVHKLGVDYVIRTLKPNKIGIATNIASILADAVRGLGYDLYLNNVSQDQVMTTIKQYENWIDILRLVQGWEIDAAKHGGAYQEVMKETLDFMDNPPESLSYLHKGLGRRVWNKPNWLAARVGKKGHDLGSVLSRLMDLVQQFEDNMLTNELERMHLEADSFSLLAKLNSAFQLDPAYFNELANHVKQLKASYGSAVRKTHQAAQDKKQVIIESNTPDHIRDLQFEEIEVKLNNYIGDIADMARDKIAELMSMYPAKDIGYVSYYVTYVDRKKEASLSFPWTVAREAFIQTLSYVENKEKQDQLTANEVVDNNITLAVCIPDAIQEQFTMEKVLEGLHKQPSFIQAVGDKYRLIIGQTEVGFVFNSAKNIKSLLGHDKYELNISTSTPGRGTRTVNLEVNELIKIGA